MKTYAQTVITCVAVGTLSPLTAYRTLPRIVLFPVHSFSIRFRFHKNTSPLPRPKLPQGAMPPSSSRRTPQLRRPPAAHAGLFPVAPIPSRPSVSFHFLPHLCAAPPASSAQPRTDSPPRRSLPRRRSPAPLSAPSSTQARPFLPIPSFPARSPLCPAAYSRRPAAAPSLPRPNFPQGAMPTSSSRRTPQLRLSPPSARRPRCPGRRKTAQANGLPLLRSRPTGRKSFCPYVPPQTPEPFFLNFS